VETHNAIVINKTCGPDFATPHSVRLTSTQLETSIPAAYLTNITNKTQ